MEMGWQLSALLCMDQDLHDETDFIMTEIIDQCTRGIPGGELGKYYHKIISEKNNKMIDFVRERTGQKLQVEIKQLNLKQDFFNGFPNRANNYIKYRYIQALIFLLPSAFKQQNVSLTHTGEKHTWIYDFYSLKKLLSKNGFSNINKFTFNTSKIIGFPFFPLDINEEGLSRKGSESMYIEAPPVSD